MPGPLLFSHWCSKIYWPINYQELKNKQFLKRKKFFNLVIVCSVKNPLEEESHTCVPSGALKTRSSRGFIADDSVHYVSAIAGLVANEAAGVSIAGVACDIGGTKQGVGAAGKVIKVGRRASAYRYWALEKRKKNMDILFVCSSSKTFHIFFQNSYRKVSLMIMFILFSDIKTCMQKK